MSENKRVTIPFLEKVLRPIVDLIRTKADKTDILQPDWNQVDETKNDFIKNKPNLNDLIELDTTLSVDGVAADAKAVGDELAKRPTTSTPCQQLVTNTDGNPVWEDRLAYKTTKSVENLPETILTESGDEDGDGIIDQFYITNPWSVDISESKECVITYNGVPYTCELIDVGPYEGLPLEMVFAAGNLAGLGGPDIPGSTPDAPFILLAYSNAAAELLGDSTYGIVMPIDGAQSVTISIRSVIETVKTIDPEFIPVDDLRTHITLTVDSDGNVTSDTSFAVAILMDAAELQNTITIIDNGSLYGSNAVTNDAPLSVSKIETNFGQLEIYIKYQMPVDYSDIDGAASVIYEIQWVGDGLSRYVASQELPMRYSQGESYLKLIEGKWQGVTSEMLKSDLNISTPDWNAAEGMDGHILNRTHYEDGAFIKQLDEKFIPNTIARQEAISEAIDSLNIQNGSNNGLQHRDSTASGNRSFAIGSNATASGDRSFALGFNAIASGIDSFALGANATTSGAYSFAAGFKAKAEAYESTAIGENVEMEGALGFVIGKHNYVPNECFETKNVLRRDIETFTDSDIYHVCITKPTIDHDTKQFIYGDTIETLGSELKAGDIIKGADLAYRELIALYPSEVDGGRKFIYTWHMLYRDLSANSYHSPHAFVVGNGFDDFSTTDADGNTITIPMHSNAHALDWDGNAFYSGDVYVQGDGQTVGFDGAKKLATEEYVDNALSELGGTPIMTDIVTGKHYELYVENGKLSMKEVE